MYVCMYVENALKNDYIMIIIVIILVLSFLLYASM